jgi:hypothetical protein
MHGGARVRVRFAGWGSWGLMVVAACCGLSGAVRAAAPTVKIGGTPVTSVLAAKYYSFQPWATDSQHRTLKFSIANKPAWAGFDPNHGRLYGSPVPAYVGTYRNVIISVSGGLSKATLPAFSIVVQRMNDPGPAISGTPSRTAVVGKPYAFQPSVRNDYGLRITFQIYNKPAWLTLNSTTGYLSGTAGSKDVGTYTQIVESVTDGYKRGSLQAFNLTVSPAAASVSPPKSAPQPTPTPPAPSTTASVSLQWQPPTQNTDSSTLTDLAGYHVYYGNAPQSLNASITIANPGIAAYVVENLKPGTWYFAVAAYNTSGLEGDLSEVATRTVQ